MVVYLRVSSFSCYICLILYNSDFFFQFVKLCHLTEVYHFHDMIEMLVGCGYKKGTTLFGYGYDFRQSNRSKICIQNPLLFT